MGVLCESGFWITAHGDDLHLEPRNGGEDPHNFFRLAARAQGEHHISIRDHAQIAVQRV